jgi:hypothetical protein
MKPLCTTIHLNTVLRAMAGDMRRNARSMGVPPASARECVQRALLTLGFDTHTYNYDDQTFCKAILLITKDIAKESE